MQRDIKPVEFQHSCVVKQQIPYSGVEGSKGYQASVGTLAPGRVVWLDRALVPQAETTPIRVYVDGIGLIRVDATSLSAVC